MVCGEKDVGLISML